MELGEYEIMYNAEDRHWWYLGMAAITRGVLDRYIGRDKRLSILDAGCGTGATMAYLRDYGVPTGVDLSPEALRLCGSRRVPRICQASITDLPFPDKTFDLITSFDVLSEAGPVKDEQGLDEFLRVLRAGYAFGETTELFPSSFIIPRAKIQPGTYRNITGNTALASAI